MRRKRVCGEGAAAGGASMRPAVLALPAGSARPWESKRLGLCTASCGQPLTSPPCHPAEPGRIALRRATVRLHGTATGAAPPEGDPPQLQLAQAAQWMAAK